MAPGDKIACRFCRNRYSPFNVEKHEKQCAMNPENQDPKYALENNRAPENDIKDTQDESVTIIRNVTYLPDTNLIAVFKTETGETANVPISFVGTLVIDGSEIPSLLVVQSNGILQAPAMIDGFVSISSITAITEEPENIPVEEPAIKELVKVEPLDPNASTLDIAKRINEATQQLK